MLRVNNIEVVYNEVILVLKGISLEVPEFGVIALLGANGAGKSTTLKAITGILETQNGELKEGAIEFMGQPIHKLDADQIVKLGITMAPEGRKVFDDLTVIENLMIGSHTRSDRSSLKKDLEMIYGYFPILAKRKDQLSIFLSGGEQQMLVIGRALMSRPKLMMLDEPSLGARSLNSEFSELRTVFRTIAKKKVSGKQ